MLVTMLDYKMYAHKTNEYSLILAISIACAQFIVEIMHRRRH